MNSIFANPNKVADDNAIGILRRYYEEHMRRTDPDEKRWSMYSLHDDMMHLINGDVKNLPALSIDVCWNNGGWFCGIFLQSGKLSFFDKNKNSPMTEDMKMVAAYLVRLYAAAAGDVDSEKVYAELNSKFAMVAPSSGYEKDSYLELPSTMTAEDYLLNRYGILSKATVCARGKDFIRIYKHWGTREITGIHVEVSSPPEPAFSIPKICKNFYACRFMTTV